jgi:exonuclease III
MASITVMTFNIESFGFFFDYDRTNQEGYKTAIVSKDKIEKFQSILDDHQVDVLCMQETAIKDPNRTSDDQINSIYEMIDDPAEIIYGKDEPRILKKVSECQSHPFTWPRTIYFYGEHSYIANSIYVRDEIQKGESYNTPISGNTGLFDPTTVPRCFSSIEIELDGTPIRIATTHLLGGRFDDKLLFTSGINPNKLIDEKIHQLSQILSFQPDIICGDFNTRLKPANHSPLKTEINNYMKQMTERNMKRRKRSTRKRIFSQWIYMNKYDKLLLDAVFVCVYNVFR